MKKMTLRPYSRPLDPERYHYSEAVQVNIYIDGQKVEAPKAGVKIGQPMFPDVMGRTIAVKMGDYIDNKEE